jgi:hypothetical protein
MRMPDRRFLNESNYENDFLQSLSVRKIERLFVELVKTQK